MHFSCFHSICPFPLTLWCFDRIMGRLESGEVRERPSSFVLNPQLCIGLLIKKQVYMYFMCGFFYFYYLFCLFTTYFVFPFMGLPQVGALCLTLKASWSVWHSALGRSRYRKTIEGCSARTVIWLLQFIAYRVQFFYVLY